ncbi:MAG: thrombospondin type 3 repeat-containing protein, partial [Anaerolineae bacterium]|nr:thrombospondin type 3 repeat-containing protein [Anaerolineae bacterium]
MKRIRHYSYGILALSVLVLVLTAALPSAAALSAEGVVRRAWQRVQYLGLYDFATELTQTQTPGPALVNVGRSSSTQTVYLEGHADQPAQQMEMSLWQNGGSALTGRDGLEIRIADGKAYGRAIGEDSWREVSDFTGAFAPGKDPLGYLAGAENIREVGKETRGSLEFTRYAFDLNGPRFAVHMRDQMEQELTAKGEFPPGVQLSLADEYVAMSGEGEIWLDSQDLPLRLTVHVAYPEAADGDRVSADIQTDFSGYPEAAAANRAGAWLAGTLHLPRTSSEWRQTAQHSGMALGVLGLVILLITAATSRKLYIAVAAVVIVSTVISPVLQSQQVAAFSENAAAQHAAQEQEQAKAQEEREYQQQMNTSIWNANADPLAAAEAAQSLDMPAALPALEPDARLAAFTAPQVTEPEPDSDADGDGLTYAQEMSLGTLPDSADSDGDGLTDNIEVQGFSYGGKLWYSNPRYYDTDLDGITDAQECSQRQRESQSQLSPDVLCQDTDGDGTPDLFDRDSDADGIPDKMDLSPTRKLGAAEAPFTYDTPFHLIINDAQPDKPLVVDLQVQPQNPEHLTYALNVLDWPENDQKGQVQRAKGNRATFADVSPGGAARDANGDIRLLPMLEIEMNGDTVPLPLTTTLQAAAYLEEEIVGQIAMTQQPDQPIQLAFTFTDAQPHTVVIYADGASCPSGQAVYTFTNVLNRDVRAVSGMSLIDLADGKRLVSVSSGAQQVCADLGNVVNGPYTDRMVDLPLMHNYGVAVREKSDGGLLAYTPLSVVA